MVSPTVSRRVLIRSKSTDEASLNINNNNDDNENITNCLNPSLTIPTIDVIDEKFSKCLMGSTSSTPTKNCTTDSDDESTPLVSELSTPLHIHADCQSSVSLHSFNKREDERSINDDCDAVNFIINDKNWDSPETSV